MSNGNLRIQPTQKGTDEETVDAGALIIPANQVNNYLNGLSNSLKALDEKIKADREGLAQ